MIILLLPVPSEYRFRPETDLKTSSRLSAPNWSSLSWLTESTDNAVSITVVSLKVAVTTISSTLESSESLCPKENCGIKRIELIK